MRRAAAVLGAAAVLAAAGCGGGGGGGGGGGASTATSAATIAPAGAPVFVSVNTDLDSAEWGQVDQLLDRFPARAQLLDSLRRELRKEGVEFERDVRPALGPELDVVWLDLAGGGDNLVILLQPRDEAALRALVSKLNADEPADNRAVVARVGEWTAVAFRRALIERLRATATDDAAPKLAQAQAFEDATGSLPDEALATLYVNGASLSGALRDAAGQQKTLAQGADACLPPGGGAAAQLRWIAGALQAQDDGAELRFEVESVAASATGESSPLPKPFDAELVSQVPAGALVYIGFDDLERGIQALRRQCPGLDSQVAPAELALGMPITLVAALFRGEGALYVRPPAAAAIPEVTLVLETADEVLARATLDRLGARLARAAGARPPVATRIGAIAAKQIVLGPVAVTYAVFDGKIVVSDTPGAISAIAEPSGPRLSDDEVFKDARAAAGAPDTTNGFLYVNLRDGIPYIESLAQLANQQIPPDVRANLTPLRSAFAWVSQDGQRISIRAFVEIR